MFVREPSWKYSGSKKLRSACSGNIRPIKWTLPLIGWEQSSPVDEEKKKKMDDSFARFFTCFRGNLLTCGRRSLVSETQNEIVVSWITLWGLMKVYWFDFSLHFRSCCLPQVHTEACISLQASWEPVNSSNCPKHVRQTKSSIKKQIIVRRNVQSMFGEQTFVQLKTGFRVMYNLL